MGDVISRRCAAWCAAHQSRRPRVQNLGCWIVGLLKVAKDRKLPFNPLTVPQATALAQRLAPHHARTMWFSPSQGCDPRRCSRSTGTTGAWSRGCASTAPSPPPPTAWGPRVRLLVKARDRAACLLSGASDSERQDGRAL